MAILEFTPEQFASMVAREIDKELVKAIEAKLLPQAERIVRQVAQEIASHVKARVTTIPPDYSKPVLDLGHRVLLQFNTEELKDV